MSNVRSRLQALVLDLDGTLLDDRAAIQAAFPAFLDAHRHLLSGESSEDALRRWYEVSGRHWRRFELGELSFAEQRRARAREFLQVPFNDLEADEAFEHYGRAYEAAWTLAPKCTEFLERTAGMPKVIVTNGERAQQLRKLKVGALEDHFLAIVTPEDCGHWKPHPAIFLAALAALNLEASSCLMIGDDPSKDLAPARAIGMETFLVECGNSNRTLLHALGET